MKRTRHKLDQIVRKLREADHLLAENISLAEMMRPDDVARLKTFEHENARLKPLLAEKDLDNEMFKMAIKGKW